MFIPDISFIIFFILLAIYLWYTFAITYHLIRFGIGTQPKKISLIFLIGSFILFTAVILVYLNINWQNIFYVNF